MLSAEALFLPSINYRPVRESLTGRLISGSHRQTATSGRGLGDNSARAYWHQENARTQQAELCVGGAVPLRYTHFLIDLTVSQFHLHTLSDWNAEMQAIEEIKEWQRGREKKNHQTGTKILYHIDFSRFTRLRGFNLLNFLLIANSINYAWPRCSFPFN